jgi:hypothetical protein
MSLRQQFGVYVLLTLVLNSVSCTSMLHSVKLPLSVRVLDEKSGAAVSNATVQLQWRNGFQGFYWGKPVTMPVDVAGVARFASEDVPPVSSDGYSLGNRIQKVFVSTIVVSAPGYEETVLKYPAAQQLIDVTIHRTPTQRESNQAAHR